MKHNILCNTHANNARTFCIIEGWHSTIKMKLLIYALALTTCTTFACEYSRTEGLFKHGFTSTVGTDNFVMDTDEDDNAQYGQSKTVTFTNKFKIFSATEFDKVEIFDSGVLLMYADGSRPASPVTEYTGTSPFSRVGQAFAAAIWAENDFDDDNPEIEYRFKYKHIVKSAITENGKDIGPSQCELQRIQNIIGDCSDNGYRTDSSTVVEALITTFELKNKDTDARYYFQTVLAVQQDRDTYVIFLYSDPADLSSSMIYFTGYITGDSNTAASKNAGVCPSGQNAFNGKPVHEQSNCRCGDWNKGIYVFKTSSGDECGKSSSDFQTECAKDVTKDNTENMNIACRPPRYLQDTCLEHVYCKKDETDNEVNIKVINPPFGPNTAIQFVDRADLSPVNPACSGPLAQEGSTNIYGYTVSFSEADAEANCDWDVTNEKIEFALRLYDSVEAEVDKAGTIYMKATCDLLPVELSVNVEKGTVAEYNLPQVNGRRVVMFLNYKRYYTYNDDTSRVPAGATVDLGENLFIAIGYDAGDRAPEDKIDPYGLYGYDCQVSNNENFLPQTGGNNNRVTQIITANTGCVSQTGNVAFKLDDSFKVALEKDGVIDYVSDDDTSTYNYVITTGAFSAAKWYVGESDRIWISCKVGFCRNQNYRANGRCSDSCGNTNVDYAERRKKRNANETTEDPYPEIRLQTSVRIRQPFESKAAPKAAQCVSNAVAYSTLFVLTVLILVAMGITILIFVRLQARQRKRI